MYLGSFDTEEAAARVFDRACLRFRGDLPEGALNFPEASYADTMPALHALSSEEAVVQLRRESQVRRDRGAAIEAPPRSALLKTQRAALGWVIGVRNGSKA